MLWKIILICPLLSILQGVIQMLFKDYFAKILVLLIFLSHPLIAAVVGQCGNHTFQLKINYGSEWDEFNFNLYHKTNNKKKLLYQSEPYAFFHVACVQDIEKRPMLFFQEHCSGNACVESRYGVFDIDTNKVLLKPSAWPYGNYELTKKILGYAPPVLVYKKNSFCCKINQFKK